MDGDAPRSYVDQVLAPLRDLRGDGRGPVLLVIACGWGLTIGGRMIYPVLLPEIRVAYGLSYSLAGTLVTVLFLAYALGQLPGGIAADHVGERRTLVLSLLVGLVALAAAVTVRSTPVLFLTTAVFGFGVGLYAVARFMAIRDLYPERFGTAIGVTNSSSEVGQVTLPPIAGVFAGWLGWEYGFAFTLPLFVVVTVAIWLVMSPRSGDRSSSVDTLSLETTRYLAGHLRDRRIVLGTAVFVGGMFVWQALTGFYPTYLVEEKGLSSTVAGVVFSLYFVMSGLIHPISGAVYDRFDIRYTFLIVGVSLPGFVALPFVEGLVPLFGVTLMLGTFLGFATAMESYLVDSLPDEMRGTGFGVIRTVAFSLGATSPLLFGVAADRGFFDEAFLLLAAFTAGMLVVGAVLPTE